MKKNIKVLIVAIIFVFLFLISIYMSKREIECNSDTDCDFFYTTYGENSCVSCSYEDEEWICMNKIKAQIEVQKIINEYFDGNPPLCERCLEPDYQSHTCKCVENKCIKNKK